MHSHLKKKWQIGSHESLEEVIREEPAEKQPSQFPEKQPSQFPEKQPSLHHPQSPSQRQ